jgi:Family of unknown function (DUF6515)
MLIEAPIGAIVTYLPVDSTVVEVKGIQYLKYAGAHYRPYY